MPEAAQECLQSALRDSWQRPLAVTLQQVGHRNSVKIFLDTSSSSDLLGQLPESEVHLGRNVVRQATQDFLEFAGLGHITQQPARRGEHQLTARGVRRPFAASAEKHLAEPLLHKVKALGRGHIGRQGQ